MVFKAFRFSMLIGTFLNALGCWIRYFADRNYSLAMFGQCMIAFSAIWALETPIGLFSLFLKISYFNSFK